jgi:hypothetical protein
MTLENKDIVQLDATVITGLLIFMTIGFYSPPPPDTGALFPYDIPIRLQITFVAIMPFVISAIIALLNELFIERMRTELRILVRRIAIVATIGGFAGIIFAFLGLLYVFNDMGQNP